MRVAIKKPAGDLDLAKYLALWGVQDMVFDPLVRYGEGGKTEPALAESWKVSDDAKSCEFKLRRNVTFSDGSPWNTDVAKWNFERWIGKPDHSWLAVSNFFDHLDIADESRLTLHFKEPVPMVLAQLAIVRPVRFMSPTSVAADGSFKAPIGTGAWVVEKNDDVSTILSRNEKYWGTKPAFQKVELLVMPDPRSRVDALRSDGLDVTGGALMAPLSPQDAITLTSAGMGVTKGPGTDTMVLGFNPARDIFKDVRVRQAVNLLIDRKAICEKLLFGYAEPTQNLFPAVIPSSGKRIEVLPRDVEKANSLLTEAGWTGDGTRQKDGKPLALELVISEEAAPGARALGEVIQSELAEVGFDVKLKLVDHISKHNDIPNGLYDMTIFITNGAPYDPYSSISLFFLSTVTGGTDGKMWTDAAALDPLVLTALSASDLDRPAAYQRVYDWLEENHAIAPIYNASRIWAHGQHVEGFAIPPTEYELPFSGISLK